MCPVPPGHHAVLAGLGLGLLSNILSSKQVALPRAAVGTAWRRKTGLFSWSGAALLSDTCAGSADTHLVTPPHVQRAAVDERRVAAPLQAASPLSIHPVQPAPSGRVSSERRSGRRGSRGRGSAGSGLDPPTLLLKLLVVLVPVWGGDADWLPVFAQRVLQAARHYSALPPADCV